MKRALIVGAGASGFLHALALRSAGVEIAAVYDPDRERARWLASLTGARPIDSLAADVDVAAICSPPQRHLEQAAKLVNSTRLVFIEKPIGVSETDLAELAALPNLVPIVQWRAGRTAAELRAAFAEDVFGGCTRIEAHYRLWRGDDYFAARADWGCGALLSIGIHAVDLILWMVGRPVRRSVRTERAGRPNVDVPTQGELAIEFEGGTKALVHITLDARDRSDFRLLVRGRDASAELLAGEGDPTAIPARWRGASPQTEEGATGSPLLVPYLHAALAGRAPTIADVVTAHVLALRPLYGANDGGTSSLPVPQALEPAPIS